MKQQKRYFRLVFVAIILQIALGANFALAEREPVEVINLSTPFGTSIYSGAVAFESVFKKANSWINMKVQPTPGAMYMIRYTHENRDKVLAGQMSQAVCASSVLTIGHTTEGRFPFQKFPLPHTKAIFSSPSFIALFSTFDPNIKTLKDLAGKKVGTSGKAQIFSGLLANQPYFHKGLGIWKQVNWQYLGAANSKDAMLNNKIDVHQSNFRGKIARQADGTYICTKMAPATPTLQLANSGRKLHYIPYDPEVIKKSYDFKKDVRTYPILVKKGAYPGIDKDIWARVAIGIYLADETMPLDVLQEIVRIRHEKRGELAKYHSTLGFFPDNPYPIGVPKAFVHPKLKQAMTNLGIPIPAGE
jgi:TRAP-type uncharacterized transport system substrate-binding protein